MCFMKLFVTEDNFQHYLSMNVAPTISDASDMDNVDEFFDGIECNGWFDKVLLYEKEEKNNKNELIN